MENYEKTYETICRICLNYECSQNMVSLIDNNTKDGLSYHGNAVLNFAKISITKHDHLPAVMCKKCLYLLKQAISFKLQCESSDKRLKNLMEISGYDMEKVKKNIVEYAMFKFYFPKEHKSNSQTSLNNEKKIKKIDCIDKLVDLTEVNDSINEIDVEVSVDNQSDAENVTYGDEILDKIESLINTNNIYTSTKMIKPFKRKHLKLKRKLAKRQKVLAMQTTQQRKNIKNLVCNICNKVLANQHTYEQHMQRHNGCRFICEHCGKGFPVQTELRIHQISRHGTGPYLQCSHCPFKAPRKFDLTEHERLHSGERPYTCEKCGLTFRRRGIWRKHLIYHTEKKIQCPQCPRKFFQRSEMLAHANNVHDRVYVFLCNKCGATYAKTATVRRHMTERHGIPREMQGKIIRVNKGASYQEQKTYAT